MIKEPKMPFPDNTPDFHCLINLSAGELAQLPVELLAAIQAELDHATTQLRDPPPTNKQEHQDQADAKQHS